MQTTVNIPVVLNIPPIHTGVSWRSFDLSFYQDQAKTIPLLLAGLPVKSQIYLPETGQRHDLTILPGATSNELLFRLTFDQTRLLTPGNYQWDVFVERAGDRDPLAEGEVSVYRRATFWSF